MYTSKPEQVKKLNGNRDWLTFTRSLDSQKIPLLRTAVTELWIKHPGPSSQLGFSIP